MRHAGVGLMHQPRITGAVTAPGGNAMFAALQVLVERARLISAGLIRHTAAAGLMSSGCYGPTFILVVREAPAVGVQKRTHGVEPTVHSAAGGQR
jgi:hypothetical protein